MRPRNKAFLIAAASLLAAMTASAQELKEMEIPEGYELADSVVFIHTPGTDTTLVGRDIIAIMPSKANGDQADVEIYQSDSVAVNLKRHIEANSSRSINGYRVRIFFDNRKTARAESEETLKRFESMYHDVKAYRTYANPYFKVTVGDFRNRSEAMELLTRIKPLFPSAFIVKEPISFPVVDKDNAYVIDTVKVLRPIATE